MKDPQMIWFSLAGLTVAFILLWLLSPILTPFLLAMILAYLANPLVTQLEMHKYNRTMGAVLIFTLAILLLVFVLVVVLPIINEQLLALFAALPALLEALFEEQLPRLASYLGIDVAGIDIAQFKVLLTDHWQGMGGILVKIFGGVGDTGMLFLLWLGYLVIVPVVTFYLLRDWDILIKKCTALLPASMRAKVCSVGRECDTILAEFFRGQLLIMICLGTIYSIGLWIAGISYSLLIGMFAGIISFIPYAGGILGILVAGLTAFFQYHDVLHLVYVVIVFVVAQGIEAMLLTPLLIGKRVGLHPVVVIFAVMAGGQLFGFFGILFALPVAAVLLVILRHMYAKYHDLSVAG